MKIYASNSSSPGGKSSFEITAGPMSAINFLIAVHLLLFLIFFAARLSGLLETPCAGGTVEDLIKHRLSLSSNPEDIISYWWSGALTYQFIHFNTGELIFSISMLWLFGHILQNKLSQASIVLLYFGFSLLSVLVFYLSHLVFPIFSGPKAIMHGAFGGVLGIMSTTVFLYGKCRLKLGRQTSVELWKVFTAALFLSLISVYENNMAYLLVYLFNICAGSWFAGLIRNPEQYPVSGYTRHSAGGIRT